MASLSESFVASIAHSLNLAQIPCVLWGHYLLILHGVPSVVGVGKPSSKTLGCFYANKLKVD